MTRAFPAFLSPAFVTLATDKDTSGVEDPVQGDLSLVPDPLVEQCAGMNLL